MNSQQLVFAKYITILALLILLTAFHVREKYVEVKYKKSNVDNKEYLVRKDHASQESADLLSRINIKLLKLIEILKQHHSQDPRTSRVAERYDPSTISEGTEEKNFTSYSINKGEKIVFCLKMRDGSGRLVDENTLTYVAIHELGHLATEEIGHGDTFWENFKWLLKIATDHGLYIYVDYEKKPQPYCGLTIHSNVLNS